MTQDRLLYWQRDKPTKEEFEKILKQFIGETGKVAFKTDRWYCTFPGEVTPIFAIAFGVIPEVREESRERMIEICWQEEGGGIEPSVSIITREQDEFTNGIAATFYKLSGLFWGAKIEE